MKDFDELNDFLIQKCEAHAEKVLPGRPADKNIRLHFEEEKERLLKLPPAPYDDAKVVPVKATKFQTVRVDRNWYSVPTAYTGTQLTAHIGCWDIRLYHGTKLVAEHPRNFGRSQWVLNPYHYLKLLQRKPGAFEEARPILDWRKQWPPVYEHLLEGLKAKHGENKGISEFLAVLLLQQEYPEKQVGEAIEKAVSAGAWSSESIRQLLIGGLNQTQSIRSLPEDILPQMMHKGFDRPDLSCYDSLLSGAAS